MKHVLTFILLLGSVSRMAAQDSAAVPPIVKGGIYDRPYLFRPSNQLAIGGYFEGMFRTEYADGVHENSSFEARRFNIFLFSAIAERIRLSSELEFEHGTEEIKLEMALIDVAIFDELNLRGGILLSPIGKFNIAHDSPRNEFNDRPLVSTRVIPATLSEVGFGLFGSLYPFGEARVTYEAYAVNGLTDGVILAGDGTSIPAGRPESFEGDNNGSPSLVGRIALMPEFGGEIGFSGHTGIYNTYVAEGEQIDDPRRLTILAVDAEYQAGDLLLQGEFAYAAIDVPGSLQELYAERQAGYYLQAVYNLFEGILPMFPRSVLSVGSRYDDINLDADIAGDRVRRLTLGLNLRFVPETVLKLDYQHNWLADRIGNESRTAVVQLGFATYF